MRISDWSSDVCSSDLKTPAATPVETYTPKQWTARRSREKPAVTAWAAAQGFTAKPGQVLVLPDNRSGRAARVLAGIGETPDLWSWAAIAQALPEGEYRLADTPKLSQGPADDAAPGWALAGSRFDRSTNPPGH